MHHTSYIVAHYFLRTLLASLLTERDASPKAGTGVGTDTALLLTELILTVILADGGRH
jgi:hypothetical protein